MSTDKEFIVYAEGLKRELRHSWLSNGRQESVADHSWRMALIAVVIAPKMQQKLDMSKVLQLAVIHDLGEIETGDTPTTQQTKDVTVQKATDEMQAFKKMRDMLGGVSGDGLLALWQEYAAQNSLESRFVRALDKLECVIQKNQQAIDHEPGATGYFDKLAALCATDSYLDDFYQDVLQDVPERDRL